MCRRLRAIMDMYIFNEPCQVHTIATDMRAIKLGIKLMICDGEERKYHVLVGAPVIVKEKKICSHNHGLL